MKCSECNKDFEAGVKSAYKLGVLNTEERIHKTIKKVLRNNNAILTANQELVEEILRLDKFHPLKGTPSIVIPWRKAKQIPQYLDKNPPFKTYLKELIREQLQDFPDIFDKIGI